MSWGSRRLAPLDPPLRRQPENGQTQGGIKDLYFYFNRAFTVSTTAFSTLTLMAEWQEGHLACKN